MKLGQLIEYNKRNIFLEKLCRKWSRKTSSRPLLFKKNALHEVKASDLQLSFNIFRLPWTWDTIRKMFVMVHCINWTSFIVWLPLLLKILGNMCIIIFCSPGCDAIKFEISLKSFCYMTRNSRQKFEYLENKKSFWGEMKSVFHHF